MTKCRSSITMVANIFPSDAFIFTGTQPTHGLAPSPCRRGDPYKMSQIQPMNVRASSDSSSAPHLLYRFLKTNKIRHCAMLPAIQTRPGDIFCEQLIRPPPSHSSSGPTPYLSTLFSANLSSLPANSIGMSC